MRGFLELEAPGFRDWVRAQWGISIQSVCTGFDIQGSPERSLSRAVIQDQDQGLFLLDKFRRDKFERRRRVARALGHLNRKGLSKALAYRPTASGEFLPFFRDHCYQVSRFVQGTALARPDYLESAPMGASFASFLLDMNRAARGIGTIFPTRGFVISDYIVTLMEQADLHHPLAHKRYLPFVRFLDEQGFMEKSRAMAQAFCHGDLHPLNVIWDQDRIKTVIDWEFAGFKPDIFDAANLVGCAGIEDPEGLGMPMVMTFIMTLKKSGIISRKGWDFFPEYVLALRFAWLSEWLRKQDEQMLDLEARFMGILRDHMDELRRIWEIG